MSAPVTEDTTATDVAEWPSIANILRTFPGARIVTIDTEETA